MLTKLVRQRIQQLEARLLKLRLKHDEVHQKCFPKDRSEGIYKKIVNEKGHNAWDNSPENIYMERLGEIIMKVKREMLGLLYYDHVVNKTKTRTFSLISNTKGAITEYSYLFDDKIDISPLYPKSEEEIKREKELKDMKFQDKLGEINIDYAVGSKDANDACHNLVKDIVHDIFSDVKIQKNEVVKMTKEGIEKLGEKYPLVLDYESTNAIRKVINKALKEFRAPFAIHLEDVY